MLLYQNVVISEFTYSLPKDLIKKVNLQNVSLRAQVDNPFLLGRSNGEGIDPESFQCKCGNSYGLLMPTYSLGLNINF